MKMPREVSNSPGSRALRLAGYVKLPGWWVHQDDLPLIQYIAEKRLPEINRIKEYAYAERPEDYNP